MMISGDVARKIPGNEVGCIIGCCIMTSMSIRKCLSGLLLKLKAIRLAM